MASNEKLKKRRLDWCIENGPCQHCNSWENLEVDHIDPSTKITHRVWSWSLEKRLAELEKCQVLCFDCHLIKSKVDNHKDFCKYGHLKTGVDNKGYKRCMECHKRWQKFKR